MLTKAASRRVLVIAHDAWVRNDLTSILSGAGHDVRQASNGPTGPRLARDLVPELIVLGSDLPELPAREVRKQLGEDPCTRQVRVVPLSTEAGKIASSVAAEICGVLGTEVS